MLDGLDDVAWGDLVHACPQAAEIPRMLRQVASPQWNEAEEGHEDLRNAVFNTGSVNPATAAVVPFLVDLAAHAPRDRAGFVAMVGMFADGEIAEGRDVAMVREAVVAQVEALTELLDDRDPGVRASAAYAATRAGVAAEPLWDCWTDEDDPAVMAALALALGEVDPHGAEAELELAALNGPPQVRIAAAVALLRAGLEWPPGTEAALVAAIDEGGDFPGLWARRTNWQDEIVRSSPEHSAIAVVEHMLHSDRRKTRVTGLDALSRRCATLRSAPAALLPLLTRTLRDPDAAIRHEAMRTLREAGGATRKLAGQLANIARHFAEFSRSPAYYQEQWALEILQRLGDPRWIEPLCQAAVAGLEYRFQAEKARYTSDAAAETRRMLTADPVNAKALAATVGKWGARAADLVPDLVAALPHAGPEVALALLDLGHDDPAAVPRWRMLARDGDLRAALAVRRLTQDSSPVLDALRAVFEGRADVPYEYSVPDLHDLGDTLGEVLPIATPHLTPTDNWPIGNAKRILAARVVAAVSGPQAAVPVVRGALGWSGTVADHAADLVADLALVSPAAVAELEPHLRDLASVAACRALARLGVPTAELAEPLIRALEYHTGLAAIAMIRELGVVEAIPALEEFAARDERARHLIRVSSRDHTSDNVWDDELLQERVRETIVQLQDQES